jgi:hypothetical protein
MRFALLQNLLTENLGLMYLSAYLQRQGNESRIFLPADLQSLLCVAIEETVAHEFLQIDSIRSGFQQAVREGITSQLHPRERS